ncbi:MAG: class I SAM-dependent methyltransferase [Methylococcales bacterium]|nr:class I SAM-dependent methyltransferase [Methylococcales bacterium]
MDTDAEWEKWGERDSYYGVLRDEKFRSHNLTDEVKTAFFDTGRGQLQYMLAVIRQHLAADFTPKKMLDFGCGTGRLVIPLAELGGHVLGVDVSDSMLKEAIKNCDEHALANVSFLKSDDNLSALVGQFDFIVSIIVFQHIPVERGRLIFSKLLEHLEEGGVCAIQLTYAKARFKDSYGLEPPIKKSLKKVHKQTKRWFPVPDPKANRRDPEMQMNAYNTNELLFLIQSAGIHKLHLEFTDHGGELGMFLYFQKPKT